MAIGLAASSGELPSLWVPIGTLCLITAFMAGVDSDPRVGPVLPIAEGALTAALLAVVAAPTEALLVCLVVPPLVAALRYGTVTSVVTLFAELTVTCAVLEVNTNSGVSFAALKEELPWLAAGFGVGLLASWMRSSHRALERAQAPYEAAHHLLSQLHAVSRTLPIGLDTRSIAAAVTQRAGMSLPAARSVVLLGRSSGNKLIPLAHCGPVMEMESLVNDAVVSQCWTAANPQRTSEKDRVCLPLRVGVQMVGVLVVDSDHALEQAELDNLQPFLDEQSLQLDTALLFDEVRALATTEERNRLAREIHDGIAQEVASLGYLVDDLTANAESPATREAATFLRHELTRVVTELRLSIFDLRHHVDEQIGLGAALSDYANAVGVRSGLSVHLDIQERPGGLPRETESELLRIAQEAITNVRKHAGAADLWVFLHTTSTTARLRIEDDGVGAAAHRQGHYGLRTINERADSIGATTTITERVGGGTVVDIQLAPHTTPTLGVEDVDHRAARR